MKVTDPVGAAAPVEENVALSDRTGILTPAVPVEGVDTVEIDGLALPTAMVSPESPHVVVNPLLFGSPA